MANDWISQVTLPNNKTYDIEAKQVEITANNNTTDGGATYYPWFGNATSGDLIGKASSALRLYEIITSNTLAGAYLCVGSGSAYGGITLHSTTSYGNIRVSDSVTSVVNYTFPAKSGTVALTSDISASGKHDDSYFVKAISSVDNEIVRFDSTSGQVQKSGVTISDNYIITIPHSNNLASGVRITGNNIAFSLGIGANDKNHGIYDEKKVIDSTVGAWILWADTANNWSFRGDAENVSGIVAVEHGGTGVNSLTANSILVSGSSTTAAITTREIYTLGSVGNSGWATVANRTKIPDMSFIAFWDGSFGNSSSSTASNLQYYSGGKFGTMAKETAANYAKLASPAFSGTPTVPTAADGTSTTQAASTAFVMNAFKANDAMLYKGIVDASHELPATHEVGWTYKVAASGTYAGVKCEIGDMIICSTSGTASNTAHWNVIQTNLDGAVIGPASSTANHIVVFDGATGKLIKGSGVTISTATPTSSAANTTVPTSKAVWAAIDNLDGNLNGTTPGTGKTISGFSQSNGIVSVTFSAISVTKGQISDFPSSMTPTSHSHGNIANGGTISTSSAIANGDAIVISTSANSGKITKTTIMFDGDTDTQYLAKSGEWKSFPVTTTNALGSVKVAYKTSQAATVTQSAYTTTPTIQARSTSSNRSYGVESDKNGVLFVTVPWTNVNSSYLTSSSNLAWGKLTGIPNASSNTAGIVKLGASDGAATYEHVHTASITATGSSPVALAAATTYTLTAGGSSIVFKTPANTDVKVKQTSTTASAAYKILLSTSSSPSSGSAYESYYSTTLTYNPSTRALVTGGSVDGLTLAAQTTGFKISGGSTTSKTLTVAQNCTLNGGTKSYLAYYQDNNSIGGHPYIHLNTTTGTTSVTGRVELVLGNDKAALTDGNAYGMISIYSTSSKGTEIVAAANSTAWYVATLQAKSGTIAYTDDITVTSVTASGTSPLTLSASLSSKKVTISGSVAAATTQAAGIIQIGTGATNAAAGNHAHGNIGNGGTLGSTASYGVATDSNKKIVAIDLSVSAPTASGTATVFVTSVTQSSQGKISVARSTVPSATTEVAGITKVGASGGAAAYSHSHGNIASGGTIAVSTSSTIANGDSIVISTSANNGKITRTKILFDGSTTTKFLSQKGEWTTPTDNDTKNTAGASNSTSKLFLVGTTAQSTSAQTYSNTYVFSTDGALSAKTLGVNAGSTANKVTMQWNATDLSLDFVFA